MINFVSSTINTICTLHNEEEQVSDLSYISDDVNAEPSAHLYKLVVNANGNTYRKSRSNEITINWLQHTVAVIEKCIVIIQKDQDTNDIVWSMFLKNNEIRDREDGEN